MESLGEPRLFGLELFNEGAFCRRCERWGLRVEAFDGCSGALEQDVFTPQGRRRPAASSNPKPDHHLSLNLLQGSTGMFALGVMT